MYFYEHRPKTQSTFTTLYIFSIFNMRSNSITFHTESSLPKYPFLFDVFSFLAEYTYCIGFSCCLRTSQVATEDDKLGNILRWRGKVTRSWVCKLCKAGEGEIVEDILDQRLATASSDRDVTNRTQDPLTKQNCSVKRAAEIGRQKCVYEQQQPVSQ